MALSSPPQRQEAFAQSYRPSAVDRFGVWLSARQIHRWVPSFTGQHIGDFGCGFQAAFARTVLDDVASVVLIDVALAPELKAHPRVTAIEGGLPESLAALPDESLDTVMMVSVLEHLWQPEQGLRELWRLLVPGGRCLINVPSWRGKRYLELAAFKLGVSPASEMDDHKMYYDVRDLWPLLVQAGFTPKNIQCFSHKFGLNTFAVCTK
ncbi:MAG TPA: methyltransferase domain-containing protein [Polyangia bacterium]|jgi:SAM-dependent methyltransferase|nr:methyltransferase domain-containing protein [Polyangia bacterium]